MNILNRHNYEEYFLLYIDDELNAAEKRAVEEFVNQYPDLKIELEMLQQSVLPPDPVVFHDKDVLLKNTSSFINETNYEEYFVLYGDDELNNEQKDIVEEFVYRNPIHHAEFALIQKARLQADTHIVFPDKTSLYRTEGEDEKVFVIRWWRIAAAAVVFLFLSGLGWYLISEKAPTPVVVRKLPSNKIDQPTSTTPRQQQESIAQANLAAETINAQRKEVTQAKQDISRRSIKSQQKNVTKQTLRVPEIVEKDIEGRNIQIASNVTKEKAEVNVDKMQASGSLALQGTKEVIDEAVGSVEPNPYAFAASNDQIEILNTTVSKKNKLRGLFRKVSRVVEKTTNIETGDGKGLRIANFEIAVK